MMTEAEVDAHLWSIGIGSDARKRRVLLLGGSSRILNAIEERLRAFGAEVCDDNFYVETYGPSSADFVIVLMPCAGDYMEHAEQMLKPEGRYLVIIEPLAMGDTLVMTSVEQVGGECVRVTGYRPRRAGE